MLLFGATIINTKHPQVFGTFAKLISTYRAAVIFLLPLFVTRLAKRVRARYNDICDSIHADAALVFIKI